MLKEKNILIKEKKQVFLECMTSYVNQHNIKAKLSCGDADVLVATTAVSQSFSHTVVLIGEDYFTSTIY